MTGSSYRVLETATTTAIVELVSLGQKRTTAIVELRSLGQKRTTAIVELVSLGQKRTTAIVELVSSVDRNLMFSASLHEGV